MRISLISSSASHTLNSNLSPLKDAKNSQSKEFEFDIPLIKYYNRIQGEAPAETRDPENVKDLTVNWPARGSIEFKNYFVKYRPNLPHVIDNLSVKINAHEKVLFPFVAAWI